MNQLGTRATGSTPEKIVARSRLTSVTGRQGRRLANEIESGRVVTQVGRVNRHSRTFQPFSITCFATDPWFSCGHAIGYLQSLGVKLFRVVAFARLSRRCRE